ncbi:MAG TPA: ABC transporter permease [Candidatus Angelobacter sp.]
MTLVRALHAELLKIKRTIALKMVVITPAIFVLLILFLGSQAPFSFLRRPGFGNAWMVLANRHLVVWALLMMPLYITLQTALIAGLDHSENQWKSLLARPVPRWTVYVAKLILVTAMTAAATLVLLCGVLIDGAILPRLQSEVTFGFPVPWATIFREGAEVAGLAFLALTIQHWVSLRWKSFSVAIGMGIIATVLGFLATAVGQQFGGWPRYFPWSLPMLALAKQPHDIAAVLMISGAAGLIVAAAGCADFCRREVQ